MARLSYTLPVGQLPRTIYTGAGNTLDFILYEGGAAFDASTITRVIVYLGGLSLDSEDHPSLFTGLADGTFRLALGGYSLGGGAKGLRVRVFDTSANGDPDNGRVWIDQLPIQVEPAPSAITLLVPLSAMVFQAPDGQYLYAVDASGNPYTASVPDVANPFDYLYMTDAGGIVRRLYLDTYGVPTWEVVP